MALKIRLRQQGRKNRPFYRVVVADVRSPRDGKYIEELGWYNPFESEQEKMVKVDAERITHWLDLGAEWSEVVEALVAKAAPAVVQRHTAKRVERRQKVHAKRKAQKKAAA